MTTVKLSVPGALLRRAKARLGKRGHEDLAEYLLCSLQALAMEGEPIDAETLRKLREGRKSPLVKMADSDWEQMLRRFDRRHAKRKSA